MMQAKSHVPMHFPDLDITFKNDREFARHFAETAFENMSSNLGREVQLSDFLREDAAKAIEKGDLNELQRVRQFSQSGGLTIQSQTVQIEKMIRQIGSSEEAGFSMTEYFPDQSYDAIQIAVDTVESISGLTSPYSPGEPVPVVKKLNTTLYSFQPGFWREQIIRTEEEIIGLRALGNQDTAALGYLQRIGLDAYQLLIRQFNRKKFIISQGIFTNQVQYGNVTVNMGIPTGNTLLAITNPWMTNTGPNGEYVMNPSANPQYDIMFWLASYGPMQKYLPYVRKLIMNPNTHQAFITNPNVRSFIQNSYANENVLGQGQPISMQTFVKYFISWLNLEIVVDNQVYTTKTYNADGSVNVETNHYFIPDGKIFIGMDVTRFGGPLGEFAYTRAVQNGGQVNPVPGPFITVEDCTAPGTRGGTGNPFVAIVSGFNAGLKLERYFDVWTADVTQVYT